MIMNEMYSAADVKTKKHIVSCKTQKSQCEREGVCLHAALYLCWKTECVPPGAKRKPFPLCGRVKRRKMQERHGGREREGEEGWVSDVCWHCCSPASHCAEEPAITGKTIICGPQRPTCMPLQIQNQLPHSAASWGLIYKQCINTQKGVGSLWMPLLRQMLSFKKANLTGEWEQLWRSCKILARVSCWDKKEVQGPH